MAGGWLQSRPRHRPSPPHPLPRNLVEEMGLFSCRGRSLKCRQIPGALHGAWGFRLE